MPKQSYALKNAISQLKELEKQEDSDILLEYMDVIAETLRQTAIRELRGASYNREFKYKRWSCRVTIKDTNEEN